jgi:branched-chain amino acid transport system permease protein
MAIREDEDVARSFGVRVTRSKTIAFLISAAFAGLLGSIYTYRAHLIEPFAGFSIDLSAAPILMAILGGTRSWIGPIVGAIVYQIVSTMLTLWIGTEISEMLFAVFLIVIVLLLPQGLLGLIRSANRRRTQRDGLASESSAHGAKSE